MASQNKLGRIVVTDEMLIPILGTSYSAGLDIRADIHSFTNSENSKISIPPGKCVHISTGLFITLDVQLKLFIFSKSGLATKNDLWIGELDSTAPNHSFVEEKELKVWVLNASKEESIILKHGNIIGQVVIVENEKIQKYYNDILYLPHDMIIKPKTKQLVSVRYTEKHSGNSSMAGIVRSELNFTNFHIFPGVIDGDFHGKIRVFCVNEIDAPIFLTRNTIFGKIKRFKLINYNEVFDVFLKSPIHPIEIKVIREDRGVGGFGSTMKSELEKDDGTEYYEWNEQDETLSLSDMLHQFCKNTRF